MFSLSCSLALSLPLLCVCEHVHFHGHALMGRTCEMLCTLYWCHEASMLRILSGAALAQCASHRHSDTHIHTRSSTVDSLLLCQGISHDQSQSFVSPGVKKVKTERRRRLEGNVVGFGAYKLFMAEQKCASPEWLQEPLQ